MIANEESLAGTLLEILAILASKSLNLSLITLISTSLLLFSIGKDVCTNSCSFCSKASILVDKPSTFRLDSLSSKVATLSINSVTTPLS